MFFVDFDVGVIGVVYVGWKGVVLGVLEVIVDVMEVFGVKCDVICVVVGFLIS